MVPLRFVSLWLFLAFLCQSVKGFTTPSLVVGVKQQTAGWTITRSQSNRCSSSKSHYRPTSSRLTTTTTTHNDVQDKDPNIKLLKRNLTKEFLAIGCPAFIQVGCNTRFTFVYRSVYVFVCEAGMISNPELGISCCEFLLFLLLAMNGPSLKNIISFPSILTCAMPFCVIVGRRTAGRLGGHGLFGTIGSRSLGRRRGRH